ncbi:DNA-directed DNA polymerase alpha catalytic subunit POL1 [Sugiyamaella lignohabitans]|uniref:DNA polymerase n=1 Tax=Sugiyamaella lignohabitans TaxID=796027 RepID=A0A167EMT1_9ASCO|nr:DNA-directed DNA polymerase alpha catalytic subunit POL1 [Sugiyamaella lignohabitans]ANB14265.1 DNA-directed DNA polymerase alpha catalytic subunit POL1 [Sugiyamaella lignohabitans]
MEDVHTEVWQKVRSQFNYEARTKSVTRKYCFELPDVPAKADYYKMLLPYDRPLPENFEKQLRTVSRIFGSRTGMFEQFVLARNIMGPGWLEVSNGVFDQGVETTSKVSVGVEDPFEITPLADSVAPPPPFTLMSISIKTVMNHKDNKHEIVAITSRVYKNVAHDTTVPAEKLNSTVVTIVRPVDKVFPVGFEDEMKKLNHPGRTFVKVNNESQLLNYFRSQIQKQDPDVILGHQLENIQLNIILHRMKALNTADWYKVGRFRHRKWPNRLEVFDCRNIFAGRLLADISNDMGRSITLKCDTWSLTEMTSLYLGQERDDISNDISEFKGIHEAGGLLLVLQKSELDTKFVAAIALKVQLLALSKQLTNLAGNSWARTLSGTRSDRNDFILLHEFFRQKYIVPDKERRGDKPKDKYQGGLVFEPEKGLYKSVVLVMDFNSLYPSIIQEYNICFTTVDRSKFDAESKEPPPVPDSTVERGILPRLIENLVTRRREVKRLIKSPDATEAEKAQWDIKQQALKLTANSMYGCLGSQNSRFYAQALAVLTTSRGREILSNTRRLMEDNGLKVIYGDTDSVMISTTALDYQEALVIGNEMKKKVNEHYKRLEIDIDNVFKRLLLLQKKKYAALNMSQTADGEIKTSMEIKGLDMKRREYCQLSKDVSKYILDQLLEEENEEAIINNIHDYLQTLGEDIRANKIHTSKFLIKNKLGKDPTAYPKDKPPQVHLALRRMKQGDIIKIDDVISYIIVGGELEGRPVGERAYTYSEVIKGKLQVDGEYYILHQIFPAVKRLCAHLEGTDETRIAECLGLDLKKHNISLPSPNSNISNFQPLESTISDEERFRDTQKLVITCACGEKIVYEGIGATDISLDDKGLRCPACNESIRFFKINAQLEYLIRSVIAKYYEGWLACDDSACGTRTRQINVYGKKCSGQEGTCRGLMSYEFSDKKVYNQLLYLESLFDVEKIKKKANSSTDVNKQEIIVTAERNRERFNASRSVVAKYLDKSGRRYVDMYGIFNFM